MTAAELMAELNSDPEYLARKARNEAAREARVAEWRRAEAPLAEDLKAAGFAVDSAWDLVPRSEPYPEALPILLEHLQRDYPDRVREGIARAMAVPDARFALVTLVGLYKEEPANTDAKNGLAVAIAGAAADEDVEQVAELVRDKTLGPTRILLLPALEKSTDRRARAALMEAGTDPDLQLEVQVILKRLRRKRRS